MQTNAPAVGLDLASGPNRRAAAEAAIKTGVTTLTAPIRLVQTEVQTERGVLLLMPIYRGGVVPESIADRAAAAVGWSYAPLIMKNVLSHIDFNSNHLHMILRDVTTPGNDVIFHESTAASGEAAVLYTQKTERDIFGRRWQIEMGAYPAFVETLRQPSPTTVFIIGLLATLMSAALTATLSYGRQRARLITAERARLATIVDNSSDPIVGELLDGTIISWNHAAERVFGYGHDEAVGKFLPDLLSPADRIDEDANLLTRIARGETVDAFDTIRIARDGTLIDVSVTASPIREADGTVSGAAKLLRDIRQQKEEERRLIDFNASLEREVIMRTAELNRTNEVLAEVLRAASEVSIIATDINGVIQIFNKGAERMLGYSAAEVVGRQTPAPLHVPEEVAARGAELTAEYGMPIAGFRAFVHKAEVEGAEKREWTYVRKDGSRLRVLLVATAMRDAQGDITGYLGIAEDITEQIRSTEALREAKATAEAANAAKSRFLAMMSHELRTPMTGVLGMADLLLTSHLNDEQRELLRTLTRSAHTLLDLLNDVLDFAKIEAGHVELEEIDFSVAQIVQDVQAIAGPLASEKGNTIHATLDPAIKPAYRGDAKRYRQVLMNLVGNANKFTTSGNIFIVVKPQGDGGEVVTLVSDTGIGIAEQNRVRLFEPFVQEDVSTSRKFGGTGLGLTISKTLVELMGGRIWVESKIGQGSTFGFSVALRPGDAACVEILNTQRQHTAASSAAMPVPKRPLRVLFAEDNVTVRTLVTTVLGKMNHVVVAVENGALAVEKARQEKFDIILMDMQMPVMDGPTAIQHIQAVEGPNKTVPVIAITADAIRGNQATYLKAGASAVVTKPIEWRRLAAEMSRLTGTGGAPGAAVENSLSAPPLPQTPTLDLALLDSLVANIDRATFVAMLDSFTSSLQEYALEIEEAIKGQNERAIKRSAHALRGVAGQFGAARLSELAKQIETSPSPRDLPASTVTQLSEATEATMAALDAWRGRLDAGSLVAAN